MLRLAVAIALQRTYGTIKQNKELHWKKSFQQAKVSEETVETAENVYLCMHMGLMLCPNSQESCLCTQILI